VLHDFSKADQEWLEPLLEAIAKSVGRLAKDDQARFMTDVNRLTAAKDEPKSKTDKSKTDDTPEREAKAKPRDRSHPAGERQGKRENALAANLKKWLAGRKQDS
jgi:PTH1 family peptidyl-tRNA hydrolase